MVAGQNANNATTSEREEIAQPSWEVRLALGGVFGKWRIETQFAELNDGISTSPVVDGPWLWKQYLAYFIDACVLGPKI